MSTVVPKLLYLPAKSQDVPVWEIMTEHGHKIYYERIHYPGLRPIGVREHFKLGNSVLNVCDTVTTSAQHMPAIFRAKKGYVAPASWYEVDPHYNGPFPPVSLTDLEPKESQETDGQLSGDEYSGEYYSD